MKKKCSLLELTLSDREREGRGLEDPIASKGAINQEFYKPLKGVCNLLKLSISDSLGGERMRYDNLILNASEEELHRELKKFPSPKASWNERYIFYDDLKEFIEGRCSPSLCKLLYPGLDSAWECMRYYGRKIYLPGRMLLLSEDDDEE